MILLTNKKACLRVCAQGCMGPAGRCARTHTWLVPGGRHGEPAPHEGVVGEGRSWEGAQGQRAKGMGARGFPFSRCPLCFAPARKPRKGGGDTPRGVPSPVCGGPAPSQLCAPRCGGGGREERRARKGACVRVCSHSSACALPFEVYAPLHCHPCAAPRRASPQRTSGGAGEKRSARTGGVCACPPPIRAPPPAVVQPRAAPHCVSPLRTSGGRREGGRAGQKRGARTGGVRACPPSRSCAPSRCRPPPRFPSLCIARARKWGREEGAEKTRTNWRGARVPPPPVRAPPPVVIHPRAARRSCAQVGEGREEGGRGRKAAGTFVRAPLPSHCARARTGGGVRVLPPLPFVRPLCAPPCR